MKYYINLIVAFIKRFKGIILAGIFMGIVLSLAVYSQSKIFVRHKKEVIGVTGRYKVNYLPNFILEEISSGLTKFDENLMPAPSIASKWETVDKGKTWVFTLQKNLYWQSGEVIKSTNINLEFQDIKTEKPDEETIVFKLENPYSPFPSVLTRPVFNKGLIGNGKWKVKKIKASAELVKELTLVDEEGNVKIYKFFPTNEMTKLAYKLGEVDKIINLFNPKPFDLWNTAYLSEEVNLNQVVVIFLNTKDKLLSEKDFRQALAYAIDKDTLGIRALGPISPKSWAYNPQIKDYAYNINRAKELLKNLPKEFPKNPEVKLVTSPALLDIAEKIEKNWQDLGVKTQILVSSIIPSDFQAYLTILDIPPDPDQYAFWHSTQVGSNISKYSNPRIDKLLEEGRTTIETEERKKIYYDLQRFLLEDLPAIFLYHPKYYSVQRK